MSCLKELRQRRVPQYVSAYIVAGWGLLQFLEFIEDRMSLSPHLVSLVAFGLLFLLPSVAIWAWSQGRPGHDRWGRMEKVALPVNLVTALVVLVVLFHGKDLGAVTTTVEVQDEHGAVSERVVPKGDYIQRVLLFPFENAGPEDDEWLRQALPMLLDIDLSQDAFMDVRQAVEMQNALQEAGYPDGRDVPRVLQRKVARESHFPWFLHGVVRREGGRLVVETELHSSENGRVAASREATGGRVYDLVDELSLRLRRDLDVPEQYIETNPDVPVAETVTEDTLALRLQVEASVLLMTANDWTGATELLAQAVERDPTFALAHHMRWLALTMTGRAEEAGEASELAMQYLYRLPERLQLAIKSTYYANREGEADKGLAVTEMWSQLYPRDVDAYRQKIALLLVRNDLEGAIESCRAILRIDPGQHETLRQIGDLYRELGRFKEAGEALQQYADRFPTNVEAWISLAELYQSACELERATEAVDRALLLEPNRLGARLLQSQLARLRGDFDEAWRLLDGILESADTPADRAEARMHRMRTLQRQGRLRECVAEIALWREVAKDVYMPLELDARHAYLVTYEVENGHAEEALAEIRRLTALIPPPSSKLIAYNEVLPLIELGRLDEADTLLVEAEDAVAALSLEAFRHRLAQGQGRLAAARGDFAGAAARFREALAAEPTARETMMLLGRALREAGDLKEAEKSLKAALRLVPSDAETNLELALLHHERHDDDKARRYLDTALRTWAQADPQYKPAVEARRLKEALAPTQ